MSVLDHVLSRFRVRARGVVAAISVSAVFLIGAAPAARANDPSIEELLTQVSQTRLAQHVQRLQDFRTRHSSTDSVVAAANWLISQHESFGYTDILQHPFVAVGRPLRNIIVTKPGVTNPEDIYIIGGHYDSTAPDVNNAPGANDDGSGTAAVLMMAEILADVPLDATVMFAHWAAEEQGLVGSGAFAAYAFGQGFGDRIRLYMNLDACGYQGDLDNVLKFMTDPQTPVYNDQLRALCTKYTNLVPATRAYVSFSDHASFRNRGIPFTYTIEDDITPFIHTPQDLLSTIDLAYFQKTVQTNLAGLITFAGSTATGVPAPVVASTPVEALRLAGPNPTPGPTAFALDLPASSEARVTIYDVTGRCIATVFEGVLGPDAVTVSWDGRDARGEGLPAGVYLARLEVGNGAAAPIPGTTVKLVVTP